jgi:hypothetical protein
VKRIGLKAQAGLKFWRALVITERESLGKYQREHPKFLDKEKRGQLEWKKLKACFEEHCSKIVYQGKLHRFLYPRKLF